MNHQSEFVSPFSDGHISLYCRLISFAWLILTLGQARADHIEDLIRTEMTDRRIPGIAVAIVRNGKTEMAKGYGFADVELGMPVTTRSAFRLASITKQFTATLVMMLVTDGKLKVHDRLSNYLADCPPQWKDVTLHHLLSHTSGIPNKNELPGFSGQARLERTHEQVLAPVRRLPLRFPPGSRYAYCNTGYYLLGMVIEKVTGKSFEYELEKRILQPLDMKQSGVTSLRELIPNRVNGYTLRADGLQNAELYSPSQSFSAGAMISTLSDMIKWDIALRTHSLVTKSTLAQMWSPVQTTDGTPVAYGYGWVTRKIKGRRVVSHTGSNPGYSTAIVRCVDDDLSVIVLANLSEGGAGPIAQRIATVLVPALKLSQER